MGNLERRRFLKFFDDLVFSRIRGEITQDELERRTRERFSEQLSLGIGASTEEPRKQHVIK